MSFGHPERLWWLCTVLMLVAVYWGGRRRRRTAWRLLGGRGLPAGDGNPGLILASVLGIVAIAQPRFGRDRGLDLPPGRDLILVIDVSRSMGAEDAVPSRIKVAIEGASSLIESLGQEPGDRVGVVAFAGVPVLRCGLTANLGAAREVVRSLQVGAVQPGGTDLASAVDLALDSFDDRDHAQGRSLLIFSDGEEIQGSLSDSLDRWKARGVAIHSVTIGDQEQGHPIPVPDKSGFLTHEGKVVESRRLDRELDRLAEATGGVLVPLGLAHTDLGKLYREKLAPREASYRRLTEAPRDAERFPLFAGLGLLALVGRRGVPLRRSLRPIVCALLLMVSFGFVDAQTARDHVVRGLEFYQRGAFERARQSFAAAADLAPGDPAILHNLAAAKFRLEQYPEAEETYQRALARSGASLKPKIEFAIGNCRLLQRDPTGAIGWYDRCLEKVSPRTSLGSDALANRAYAKRLIPPDPEEPGQTPGKSQSKSRETPQPSPDQRGQDSPESARGPINEDPGAGTDSTRGPQQGGAGGDGKGSGESRTPERRLRDAVESIRRAREGRLTEVPRPPDSSGSRKDW